MTKNKAKSDNQKEANLIGLMFCFIILSSILANIIISILYNLHIFIPQVLYISLAELVLIIPILFWIWIKKYSLKNDLGFRPIHLKSFLLAILFSFVTMPIASFINILTQFFVSNTMVDASNELFQGSAIATLIVGSILGPIVEEFVFRGAFFNQMYRVSTPIKAVLVSALCFGLMHLNFNQACYAIVLGALFALLNIASGSIYTSMIAHITINGYNLLMMLFSMQYYEKEMGQSLHGVTDSVTGNAGYLIPVACVYGIISIGCIILSILLLKKIAKIENNLDALNSIICKKNSLIVTDEKSDITDNSVSLQETRNTRILLNVPMLLACILCFIFMIYIEL